MPSLRYKLNNLSWNSVFQPPFILQISAYFYMHHIYTSRKVAKIVLSAHLNSRRNEWHTQVQNEVKHKASSDYTEFWGLYGPVIYMSRKSSVSSYMSNMQVLTTKEWCNDTKKLLGTQSVRWGPSVGNNLNSACFHFQKFSFHSNIQSESRTLHRKPQFERK